MKKALFLFLSCFAYSLMGQDFPRNEFDLSKITDDLYGSQETDINYEDLYENVMQLLSRPINLNKATDEDLQFLHILSLSQIKNLLKYRKENNNLLSIYELQVIPEFDMQTIYKLVPFVIVTDPSTTLNNNYWSKLGNGSDHYVLVRYERTIQRKKGNSFSTQPEARFHGSPDKLYVRYRSSRPGDYSIGFTAEKDAGETIEWTPAEHYYGMDYFSFHMQLQNKGKLKNLVLGDYQCQFGQGLMLGGILGMGKGSETITTLRRSNLGLMPYTSVYEAGALRGIGATMEVVKHLYLTSFFSNTRRDATNSTDSLDNGVISSFQTTGLHRNENELLTRKQIHDKNWGTILQYKRNQLDLGVMFNRVIFDDPVQRVRNIYNQFSFGGIQNKNVGLFLNYGFQNVALFGEFSHTLGYGNAFTSGILWGLSSRFDVSILYRNFDRDFHTFYSDAFSENTSTQNERGVYWGWKYRLTRTLGLTGYFDFFQFPWLRYRGYAPSTGYECLLKLSYQPSKSISIFAQGRQEYKDRNTPDQQSVAYQTAPGRKRSYCVSVDFGLRKKLRLKTRVQFSSYRFAGNTTSGVAIAQDIRAEFGKFKFTGRYALFDTQDYDNRQYVYENDVYLAYSMPAYAAVGVRKIAMLEYKINHHLSIWLRYAHTRYAHEETIASGVETIEGNKKDDLKFQLRITF